MIKLQSGSILLRQADGGQEFLDLDALHDDLWASCQAAGIDDPETPDDILGVICAFLDRGASLSPAEVDGMVLQILCDSGMRALADQFAQRRHASATNLNPDEVIRPDSGLVAEIINEQPFLLGTPTAQLTNLVLAQLEKLEFGECSRRLVVELARNSWHNLRRSGDAAERELWLIHRRELTGLLPGEARRLLAKGVLQILSVSALFPAVQGHVDLLRLARQLGPSFLPELQFCPAVEAAGQAVLAAYRAIAAEVHRRRPETGHDLPGRIEFRGLKAVVQEYLQNNRREEQQLERTVHGLLAAAFGTGPLQAALN